MDFVTVLNRRHVGLAILGVGALFVVACADGSRLPTSPSAASAQPGMASMASGGVATAAGAPRSGSFQVLKECSHFNGTNGTFCTITDSTLPAIEADSRVTYATVNGFGALDSDVVLDLPGPGNNAAFGHCILNATVTQCTFSGGTGKFTHFSATVHVTNLGGGNFSWVGTYSFSPRD